MGYNIDNLVLHIHWCFDELRPAGSIGARNYLDFHSFYWIHEGKGIFRSDQEYPVEAGMLVYLKPGLPLTMESDQQHPLRIIMVLTALAHVPYEERSWKHPQEICELNMPLISHTRGSQREVLDGIFRQIVQSWLPGSPGGEVIAKTRLLEVLGQWHKASYGREVQSSALAAYESIKEHIEQHFSAGLTCKSLAQNYDISVSYLRKLFLKHLGQTPKAYISQIRNNHAKRYLSFSNLSMKDIAVACGYMDEYHFSKMFKQANGMSPSRYRREEKSL